ncbi:hypothetical protein ACP70R_019202 [Stipagrostis hirtigluma subsp. patula]
MDAHHHRLLPPPLLAAWLFFFLVGPPVCAAAGLHPVVLLPGYGCGQLDARLTAGYDPAAAPSCGGAAREWGEGGWFRLWENYTALREDPSLAPCYAELLRLTYDPVAGDYRNVPGVETRVAAFGSTRGFGSEDPARKNNCMERLVLSLELAGYTEGENLFGASYDLRQAAAAPEQASAAFSDFSSSLTLLVERASRRNGGRPAILVTHSLGGLNAVVFLQRSPLPWRRRYVKHLVMVSTGAGGSVPLLPVGGGPAPPPGDVLSFGGASRSFAVPFLVLPSPRVFGHAPLVITRARNYSAYEMAELLAAAGFSGDEVARCQLPST